MVPFLMIFYIINDRNAKEDYNCPQGRYYQVGILFTGFDCVSETGYCQTTTWSGSPFHVSDQGSFQDIDQPNVTFSVSDL